MKQKGNLKVKLNVQSKVVSKGFTQRKIKLMPTGCLERIEDISSDRNIPNLNQPLIQ